MADPASHNARDRYGHRWRGRAIGDGDGDWYCPGCHGVCDHETPCGRHGACGLLKRTWIERLFGAK